MSDVNKRLLKVFLCHASGDKPPVRELYNRLTLEGVDAWLDKEKLLPGQDWRLEIPRAVRDADVVVVCLSKKSTTKEGYVQREIKFALDIAEEKPEGTIFLIPARLEECTVPERLNRWQWVDLYEDDGFIKLLRSLKLRADAVGATVEPVSYVDSKKEADRRLEQLYTEGLAAFYTEDWDRACQRFQSILSERPNHKQAAEKLEEAERQRDLAKLYEQATGAVQNADWGVAIQILETLSQKSADYKDVEQMLRNARRQKQLRELYSEAKALHTARQWEAVVKVFEQISSIDSNYPDGDELLPSAQKEVAELRRLAGLNDQYSHALREMDSGNWYEARRLLETVHKSQTGFLETEKLLKKVENEIVKEEEKRRQNDQINTLYEQAHGLLRSKKWRNALDKMDEIRKLDDKFPDTDGIAEKAQKELAREEQEAERQNTLAALYAEAVKLLKEEKYQDALDKWNEVRAIDPKYPDRQWVGRMAKRKLAGGSNVAVIQTDAKHFLTNVFTKWETGSQTELETSIVVQTRAGWLIMFVALGLGFERFVVELLARVTGFFGIGVNFWSTEIIVGTFGLLFGLTIWLMLRFLRVAITGKNAIVFIAGWLMGFLITPIIGWYSGLSSGLSWTVGYLVAGLVSSLCTALVLKSESVLHQIRQVIFIVLGMTISLYLSDHIYQVLQNVWPTDNMLVVEASFHLGLGSFFYGFFSAWVLYVQVYQRKESSDLKQDEWVIIFVTVGLFFARFIAEWTSYNLFAGVGIDIEHPDWPIKTFVAFSISGILSGIVLWAGIKSVSKQLTVRHLLLLVLYWTAGMILAGAPGIVLRSGEAWVWSLGLFIGCTLAMFFSLNFLHPVKIVENKIHLIFICSIVGLGFAIGNLWVGDLYFDNLRYMREDIALAVALALQSALAGFLGMTALLGGKIENNQRRQLNWKIALGGALGLFVGELLFVLVFQWVLKEDSILIDSMLYGLFWGVGIVIITKDWRSVLLLGILGALTPTSALLTWWFLQGQIFTNVEIGRIFLYLVFGFFFGVIPSVGHRRSSAILLLYVASFLGLFVQKLILPNQMEGTITYWISSFTRDLVLGGLIGLAWAYFLHPLPVSKKEQTALA